MKKCAGILLILLLLPQATYAQGEESEGNEDVHSPYIELTSPGDILPAGTNNITVSVFTEENATCKYSTIADTPFDTMTSAFSITGGVDHSSTINNLASGNSYEYYVRCKDEAQNKNEDDYIISFSVEEVVLPVDTTDYTNDDTDDIDDNQPPTYTPPPYIPPPQIIIPQTFDDPVINVQYVDYVRSVYKPPIVKRKVSPPTKLSSNLKLNSKGLEVLLLQKSLNLLGYTVATTGPNSVGKENSNFDLATKQALISYQNNYVEGGLVPSGILDNATIIILNSDINKLVAKAESIATTTDQLFYKNKILLKISRYFDSFMDRITDFIIRVTK